MNILAFTPFSTMFGGANRSFLMVIKGLINKFGHNVFVVVPEEGQLVEELQKEKIEYSIVPFHRIHGINSLTAKSILSLGKQYYECFEDIITAHKISKVFKAQDIQLVYINDRTAVVGAFVAQMLKIPYVWHFRSDVNIHEIGTSFVHRAYKKCTKIITISEEMKTRLLLSRYAPLTNITKILNGIPKEIVKRAPYYKGGPLHMLLCGRITPEKGHTDALRALKILDERGFRFAYLHIVGDTLNSETRVNYLKELKEIIKADGTEDLVCFEGQVKNMAAFREKMNIELMCSICEPFGRVTVEGMRSGLVVIGSNTGGTKEIIEDNVSGLLYKQGDSSDLADKIMSVFSSPDLYAFLADNAYEYANNHFSEEENLEAVNQVLVSSSNYYK